MIGGQRVLDADAGEPEKLLFRQQGIIELGTTATKTYWTFPRSGGAMYSECRAALMSKDGQELATWTGYGVGRFTSPGKIRITGSFF